jgi:membrane-associated phospholipid phosphatase
MKSFGLKKFFYVFFNNLGEIFVWPNFFWHVLSIVLTYLIVATGLDWYYFSVTRSVDAGWVWMPAAILGSWLPLLVPLLLYVVGKREKNFKMLNASFAVAQAVILGVSISSFYKAFTGRIPPDLHNIITDISHGFRFGFWEGGIFWGWPSSHATIAFAMVVTLIILFAKNKKIRYLGIFYALYIAFGASIGFHWISEVISGIIIGTVIGLVVGKSFRKRFSIEGAK